MIRRAGKDKRKDTEDRRKRRYLIIMGVGEDGMEKIHYNHREGVSLENKTLQMQNI